ncbi:hypothetical protein CVV65_12235 [Kyrpidia spormannii]|uniref:Uncharacterized protein n=1 Tax=Kyrpidia spormannii TaxID=2055160 RepID=A0A2K8NAF8_9BACL|nr:MULTISPECIES: hypothetical protein [Kyrpidia]ATY85600.1 hypothetical protein CVV65_12235 [Kyrpidia spormannii]MCL6574820.1 hypothetical protein [Kyrpidia sp.]HHY67419.1 hypothetical protein [Alicyclobacillus sp.]
MQFLILLSVFLGLTILFVGGYIWTNHIRGKVVYLPADQWSEEAIRQTIADWEAQGWVWERTNEKARSIRFKRG